MNILIYCNAFLPKIDGIVFRIKMFLDSMNNNKNVNITLITPYKNVIKKYKRFDIINIPGIDINILSEKKIFPELHIIDPKSLIDYYDKIKKICLKKNINLIHIYHGDTFNKILKYISQDLDIPLIISYHTNIFLYMDNYKMNHIIKKMSFLPINWGLSFDDADLILNVSKENEKRLLNQNIIKNKNIKIMPYIIDNKIFFPIKKKKNKKTQILMISRIELEKNIDIVFDALKKINNFELTIIGDGSYLKDLKKKYKSDNIFFLGKIKNTILYKYYNKADIFINPSKTESLGFTTLESMACKTIVIGYNGGGTKDLIEHMKTGFLFNDLNELVSQIKFLQLEKNLKIKNKIILKAYNFIKNYTPENFSNKMLEYYKIEIQNKKNKNKLNFNLNFLEIRILFIANIIFSYFLLKMV